jgi:hypothetical protein
LPCQKTLRRLAVPSAASRNILCLSKRVAGNSVASTAMYQTR